MRWITLAAFGMSLVLLLSAVNKPSTYSDVRVELIRFVNSNGKQIGYVSVKDGDAKLVFRDGNSKFGLVSSTEAGPVIHFKSGSGETEHRLIFGSLTAYPNQGFVLGSPTSSQIVMMTELGTGPSINLFQNKTRLVIKATDAGGSIDQMRNAPKLWEVRYDDF